jgi:hypothetical protein
MLGLKLSNTFKFLLANFTINNEFDTHRRKYHRATQPAKIAVYHPYTAQNRQDPGDHILIPKAFCGRFIVQI